MPTAYDELCAFEASLQRFATMLTHIDSPTEEERQRVLKSLTEVGHELIDHLQGGGLSLVELNLALALTLSGAAATLREYVENLLRERASERES